VTVKLYWDALERQEWAVGASVYVNHRGVSINLDLGRWSCAAHWLRRTGR
jgi:hypothetical protein